jgi:hypothetical protein
MSPEYVYLLRTTPVEPIWKMPAVLLPAAAPACDAADDAVADATTQPEKVYLLRVVVLEQATAPNANIPSVASNAAVMLLLNALIGDGP